MTMSTYRHYSGSAAELYQSFFVPAIAEPVSRELLRTADLQPGERVLDVACGTGVVTRAAAEHVGSTGTVTGVDVAPEMIEVAKATPAAGAPIQWYEADAASLPLPDASYDVAFCQMGLMFVEDQAGALAEMHRVLAPGGRIVINTPGRIQPLFEAMERAIVENLDPQLGAFVSAVFSLARPRQAGHRQHGEPRPPPPRCAAWSSTPRSACCEAFLSTTRGHGVGPGRCQLGRSHGALGQGLGRGSARATVMEAQPLEGSRPNRAVPRCTCRARSPQSSIAAPVRCLESSGADRYV